MNRRVLLLVGLVVLLLLVGGGAVVAVRALSKSEAEREERLLPQVQAALERTRQDLAAEGIETWVGSTKRTDAEQAAKVAAGVSTTSNSWHLLGRAVDLYPVLPGTNQPDLKGEHVDRFRRMHAVAAQHGFRGLAFNADGSKRYITGSKGKIWDGPHLEYPEGMTFAQAKAKDPARA